MAVGGLVAAAHPVPCLAVTLFTLSWAGVHAQPPGRLATLATAVLLGQVSIGWGNDALDAPRDRRASRRDKPLATGGVSRRTVAVLAVLALAACVPASLALGLRPGLVHLLGVAAGWAYNLGLKATWASAVPYAVAFAVLPAVAVPGSPLWVSAVAGLLGVAAHFANTVGDTEADAATGVRGLPQRLGPEASLRLGAALVLASGVVLLLGSAAGTTAVARAVGASSAAAGAGVALVVAAVGRRLGRRAFSVMLLAVALVVTGTLVAGRAG